MSDPTPASKRRPVVLNLTQDQCVWSRAGVVPPRACHNAFDCTSCSYDQLVQRKLATGRLLGQGGDPTVGWRDPARYQKAAFTERPCRHMLTGAVPVKYCSRNFECATCPYDQMLEDAEPLQDPVPSLEYAGGFEWANRYYLSRGHLWMQVEYGGRVRVGMDDFAARLLGPLDAIRLPRLGATTGPDIPLLHLERGDHAASLVCPFVGTVVAVNPDLATRPTQAHASPYGRGWLFMLEPVVVRSMLKGLLHGDEAVQWLEAEGERLRRQLAPADSQADALPLAATGGRALPDILGSVEGADWDTLVQTFLTPEP